MSYVGDFLRGQSVTHVWTTNSKTGARINLSDALEAGDVVVLRGSDNTALATPGLTVSTAIGGRVGVHRVVADTTAASYVAGDDYFVLYHPDTETIDGELASGVLMHFSIENRPPNVEALPALSVGAHPLLGVLDSGTAQSATSTTVRLRAAATFADDALNGATVAVFGSTQGYWQTRAITDYASSTDEATVDTWAVTPSGTITYVVFAGAPGSTTAPVPANVVQVSPNSITATAIAANAITSAKIATDAIGSAQLATSAVSEIQTGLATATALAAVDQRLDTEIPAILAAVDTEVAAIKARTDLIPDIPAAANGTMALTSDERAAIVRQTVRALNGLDGYGFERDETGETIRITIPGVGVVTTPAVFADSARAVTKIGA